MMTRYARTRLRMKNLGVEFGVGHGRLWNSGRVEKLRGSGLYVRTDSVYGSLVPGSDEF